MRLPVNRKALHGTMAKSNTSPQTQTYTILLVDDDAETLDTWAKGLEKCRNYRVLKVDTVKSALMYAAIRKWIVWCWIWTWMMPRALRSCLL